MDFKDYYATLGVAPEADEAAIKAAYRKLARKYHPDVSKEPGAEDKFKEVSEAYEVLRDAARRADYDQLRTYRTAHAGGRGGFEPPPGWQPSGGFSHAEFTADSGFSDFFEQIFGGRHFGERGFGGRGFSQGHDFAQRGQDLQVELPVLLEELVRSEQAGVRVTVPSVDALGRRVPGRERTLEVKLPPGTGDGELIRLAGQGAPGIGRAPPGDLFVRVRLVPHPRFDVEGHNLLVTVPVAPWEAALGAKVIVPTLASRINLTIPPGSQSGQKLRIKGRGLPGKAGTGDLIAVLKIVLPQAADAETQHLWQRLADKAAFDPRAEWRS
jgi:curved DNA-binding protein